MTSCPIRGGALACALMISVAQAQGVIDRPTDPAALAHFAQGNAHYKLAEFQQAIDEYKAGARIQAAARFDFNLGQCYRLLNKPQEAIFFYGRYLHSGVASPEDATQIQKWIAELNAALAPTAPTATPAPVPSPVIEPPPPTPHAAPWYHDGFGWGLAGSGLALASVGGWLEVHASSQRSDADKTPNQQQQNALRSSADSNALAGTIVLIGGGALLVTGIIKLAIHDHDPEPTMTAARWNIGVSTNAVFVFGRF